MALTANGGGGRPKRTPRPKRPSQLVGQRRWQSNWPGARQRQQDAPYRPPSWTQWRTQYVPSSPPTEEELLPGRLLTSAEARQYMPTTTPFESYEQRGRAVWPSWATEQPMVGPAEAAQFREQVFGQARIPPATQQWLRTKPIYTSAAGEGIGWGLAGPEVLVGAQEPMTAIHEYAHYWRPGPEQTRGFLQEAQSYVDAARVKFARGEPLSMWEDALKMADDYTRDMGDWAYPIEFYANVAGNLTGEVWRLPVGLRKYYEGLFSTRAPNSWGAKSWRSRER